MELSQPHNWCDRQCERCVLQESCQVSRRVDERRRRHEKEGRDPYDWGVVLADVSEDLAEVLRGLAAIGEELEPATPVDEPPTSLVAHRLRDAGMRFAERVDAILRVAPGDDVQALWSCALLFAMKVSRLRGYLEMPDDGAFEHDGAPNCLLLERVDRDARRALDSVAARFPGDLVAQCDSARREVVELLEHAFGPVPERVRLAVGELEAEGRAPSPFCVREPSPSDSGGDGA